MVETCHNTSNTSEEGVVRNSTPDNRCSMVWLVKEDAVLAGHNAIKTCVMIFLVGEGEARLN